MAMARLTEPVAIAVFARAPQAGHAKTRLIPSLGPEAAARLQEAFILRTLHTALDAGLGPVSLWCAPETCHPVFQGCQADLGVELYSQCEGDLGRRMADAFHRLVPQGPVLLIGTDCPALTPAHLIEAARHLREGGQAVFIPAEDGGYVLAGLRQPLPFLFEGISWGGTDVMEATRELLRQAGIIWRETAVLWDVDLPCDLQRLQSSGLMAEWFAGNAFLNPPDIEREPDMTTESLAHEAIQDYYGKVLKTNDDLKTSACCSADSMPENLRQILAQLNPEVKDKFYGCGSPIPPVLEGRTVLDLGSGSGRDCFILSKLVGAEGRVIGVDMTDSQLETANQNIAYHTQLFAYAKPNVEFHKGYIEDLQALGLQDNSVDVVVSNCVINLSPDKRRVFSEIFRVLKPGGELYFSDVFADRRIPPALASDPVLLGECLGGALYTEDFRRMLLDLGCPDFRVTARSEIQLNDPAIEEKAGMIGFSSMTIRAFKLDLEDRCEDYGQVAYYQGGIPGHPHGFILDDHHHFKTGRPMPVCGNTAAMLGQTRYAPYFRIIGDTSIHYGLFDCAPKEAASHSSGACC